MRKFSVGVVALLGMLCFEAPVAAEVPLRQVDHRDFTHLAVGDTSGKRDGNRAMFRAEALWDGRLWSAWGCDDLEDAWVEIEFPVVRYVTQIQVLGGHAANNAAWQASARPRKVRIVHDGGDVEVELQDGRSLQVLAFLDEPIVSSRLRLEVLSTYGAGPLAISEIKVYEPEDVFALKPELRQEIADAFESLGDAEKAQAGAQRLIAIGPPAMPWLTLGLQGQPAVRDRVAEVFARSGLAGGVDPITAALSQVVSKGGDTEADLHFVKTSLGYLADQGAPQAVSVALTMYRDAAWRVAAGADLVHVLASSGHPAALATLTDLARGDDERIAQLALAGFGRLGQPGFDAINSMAQDPTENLRRRAAQAVAHMTVPHDVAVTLLRDESPLVRTHVLRAMAVNPLQDWQPGVLAALDDEETEVRAAALTALGAYAGEVVIARSLTAVEDRSAPVRRAAVMALERQGEAGLGPIVSLVATDASPHKDVRTEAMRAIVRQGERFSKQLTQLLVEALNTDNRADRQAAAYLLASCGAPGTAHLFAEMEANDPRTSYYARRALESRPNAAIPLIRARLAHGGQSLEPSFIAHTLAILAAAADPGTTGLLVTLMHDRRDRVRADTMAAANQIQGPGVTELLLSALDDESKDVREHAATGLGMRKERRAVASLIEMVRSEDTMMLRAIWALGEIGDAKALTVLHDLRAHNRSTVRQYVCQALGKIGETDSLAVLIELVDDSDELVRFQATRAVEAID